MGNFRHTFSVVKTVGILAVCFLMGCQPIKNEPPVASATSVTNSVPEGYRVSFANACILNLRMIDNAKKQWALEHNATNGEIVIMAQLTNYIPVTLMPNFTPICHAGGIYSIRRVGEPVTCSLGTNIVPAHILESKLQAP
jgi:hypothetical protein